MVAITGKASCLGIRFEIGSWVSLGSMAHRARACSQECFSFSFVLGRQQATGANGKALSSAALGLESSHCFLLDVGFGEITFISHSKII